MELQSAVLQRTDTRTEQQRRTAKKYFSQFIQEHGEEKVRGFSCDSIPPQFVTPQLIGCFGSYLFMKMNKVSAAQSYLSQIKSYFDTKWQDNVEWILHPSRSNDKWYSDIRSGVRRMYINRAIAEGSSLVDQAPPMYRDSLQQICAMLVANNTSMSLRARDLLVTQWHCMGRAVETGLRHSSMKFVPKPIGALQFIVRRSKTNVHQHVHAFCDRESWEADIFHAKASHLATCANVDDEFQFRNVTAKMINTILSNICGQAGAEELSKFTNHSGRRGCASEALSHNGVSVTKAIARGGWAFDAVSRVFLYFCGCDNGDMRVGRVVAGWPETDKGGTPPNANSLTKVDRASFRALAIELYKQYLSFYDASVLEVLTASLVMYYNDVRYKWAKMDREDVLLLLTNIEAAACRVGVFKHDLSNWSTTLRNRWIVDNLPWLSVEQQAETATKDDHEIRIDTYSLHDVLTRQASVQHQSTVMLAKLQQAVETKNTLIQQMGTQIAAMSTELQLLQRSHLALAMRFNTGVVKAAPTICSHQAHDATAHPPANKASCSSSANSTRSFAQSLKGVRASSLFMEYMCNRWYAGMPAGNKEVVRKIKLTVERVKDFLPAGTVLTDPPPAGSLHFKQWYVELEESAKLSERSMISYIDQIRALPRKRERNQLFAHLVSKDLAYATAREDYPKRHCLDNMTFDINV